MLEALSDGAQSYVFCSQIVTEEINAMFLVASKWVGGWQNYCNCLLSCKLGE